MKRQQIWRTIHLRIIKTTWYQKRQNNLHRPGKQAGMSWLPGPQHVHNLCVFTVYWHHMSVYCTQTHTHTPVKGQTTTVDRDSSEYDQVCFVPLTWMSLRDPADINVTCMMIPYLDLCPTYLRATNSSYNAFTTTSWTTEQVAQLWHRDHVTILRGWVTLRLNCRLKGYVSR